MTSRAFAFGPVAISSGFLPSGNTFVHCVDYRPAGREPADTIVLVPPFAEEMNQSRRMFHRFGRRLAAGGRRVVLPDLTGTGDSGGTFDAATWEQWLTDVAAARAWARTTGPAATLVGLRLGALLAAAHARAEPVERLVLWDPVLRGRDQIRDFLRQQVLAERFTRRVPGATSVRELETLLESGQPVEVAGYLLAPGLASSIAGHDLATELPETGEVHWLHLGGPDEASLAPAARALIRDLQAAGRAISVTPVPGPRFWATSQSSAAPVLIDETERLLNG